MDLGVRDEYSIGGAPQRCLSLTPPPAQPLLVPLPQLSLSMIALGMAPLAILSPVFGLAIVFSAVLARLGWVPGVHETLSYAEWLSIAMVVTGIGLCSAYGPSSEDELPFDEIGGYFGRPAFLSYACPALAFVFGWVALLAPRSPLRAWRPDPRSLKLSIGTSAASGIAGAFSTVFGKIVSEAIFTRLLSKGDTSVVSNGVTWAALLGTLRAKLEHTPFATPRAPL